MSTVPTELLSEKIILHTSHNNSLCRADVRMFELLFKNILDIFFYVKDGEGKWISCNIACLELLNITSVLDVVGITEKDFFPRTIAKEIRQDDLRVLHHGESILNRTELISNNMGDLVWVNTNKLPVYNANEKIIGLIGLTKLISGENVIPKEYKFFGEVIDYIGNNLVNKILTSDLSRIVNISESQFRRKFNIEFGMSPQQFILRARLQASANMLRNRTGNIGYVAAQSGFSDQSYFTRQFKNFFGKTPKAYRQLYE